MGVFAQRIPWTRQPPKSLRIDQDNEFGALLLSAWVGNQTSWGVMLSAGEAFIFPTSQTGTYTLTPGVQGVGLKRSSGRLYFPANLNASSSTAGSAMSRLAVLQLATASGVQTISASTGSANLQFRMNGTQIDLIKQEIAAIGSTSSGVVASNETCILGCSLVNGSRYAIYKNGLSIASSSTATSLSSNAHLELMSRTSGGAEPFNGTLFLHLEFPVELSAASFTRLSANPWQVFAP